MLIFNYVPLYGCPTFADAATEAAGDMSDEQSQRKERGGKHPGQYNAFRSTGGIPGTFYLIQDYRGVSRLKKGD